MPSLQPVTLCTHRQFPKCVLSARMTGQRAEATMLTLCRPSRLVKPAPCIPRNTSLEWTSASASHSGMRNKVVTTSTSKPRLEVRQRVGCYASCICSTGNQLMTPTKGGQGAFSCSMQQMSACSEHHLSAVARIQRLTSCRAGMDSCRGTAA